MSRTRYGLAIASAATLASLSCGALAGAAIADPGGVPHQGDHGKHVGQIKNGDKGDKGGKGPKGPQGPKDDKQPHGQPNGHAYGHAHAPGQQAGHGQGTGGSHGNGHGHASGSGHANGNPGAAHSDPPGNNGTVKIAAPSDEAGHPSNNPHPGCTVVVEWFGFDAGDDVVSTVSFAPQAPTSDATIGGTEPSSVFVGGDAASGGTDLDGRQAYTLTFTGDPHPKQGYHVKLTVATPHSLGNDTKSKVFWVEPCAATPATETPGTTSQQGQPPATPSSQMGTSSHSVSAPGGTTTDTTTDTTTGTTTSERADSDAPVPTAVDAGEDSEVLPEWARSPLPLVAIGGGLVLVAAALARRARNGA